MEISPSISFSEISADMVWIYAIYRIFKSGVKRQILIALLCTNTKRANPCLGFTLLICDYFRTPAFFQVHDICMIVGVINGFVPYPSTTLYCIACLNKKCGQRELISIHELVGSNTILYTIYQLMIEKEFFTEAEFLAKMKEVQADYRNTLNRNN